MSAMVYIRTNMTNNALYTGVTNAPARRNWEHRNNKGGAFSQKYKTSKLVWYQLYEDITDAILKEKTIKGGSRAKKIALIEAKNPAWRDLSQDLYE